MAHYRLQVDLCERRQLSSNDQTCTLVPPGMRWTIKQLSPLQTLCLRLHLKLVTAKVRAKPDIFNRFGALS